MVIEDESAQRARVVEVARTYIGTPYIHHGTIRGAGVDCATVLALTYAEAGMVPQVILPAYSPQWHLHRDEQKYTAFIASLARETERRPPLPGDIIVWKFHRAFAHGGIVTDWPHVIHAFIARGCYEDDALANQMLATVSERVPAQGQPRPWKLFTFWPD